MLPRCAAWLMLSATLAQASPIFLSRVGDVWKYIPGQSAPGTAGSWRSASFNDDAWMAGRSGFSAGFSATQSEATPLQLNSASAYFRRTFVLTNTGEIA